MAYLGKSSPAYAVGQEANENELGLVKVKQEIGTSRTYTISQKGISELLAGKLNEDPTAAELGFEQLLDNTGWVKFPNGMILQWGKQNFNYNNQNNSVTYPTTFPNGAICGWSNLQVASALSGLWVSGFTSAGSTTSGNFYGMFTNDGRTLSTTWFVLGH